MYKDNLRDRIIAYLCNSLLRFATPIYRESIDKFIRLGIEKDLQNKALIDNFFRSKASNN